MPPLKGDFSTDPLVESNTDPFSDELRDVFGWITCSSTCQLVCIFGIGSNIVNIICFVKQGFKDPVNVSFVGLAVADTGCLITVMLTNMCVGQWLKEVDLPFEPIEFQQLVFSIPHAAFSRISCWITALITLERCLCITVPMKVKSIVTSKRIAIIIACVYVTLSANIAPVYVTNRLGLKFYPERNKTLIGIITVIEKETLEMVSYIIQNSCMFFLGFVIILTCTIILVIQLQKKAKWRTKSTTSTQGDIVSKRNQEVAKMAVMISLLFFCCFMPLCVLYITVTIEPELSVVGKYKNALVALGSIGILLESVNSASNIFIYYHMSSKYRAVLHQLLYTNCKH